ncbi:MAG TPA: site-specific DNA-methyltransferase [Nitrospinota bacterium]|mgnify:CR=1 FL=1|nr:site-specific DNA-methyltransferase [Nitrospinota bacterium]|tara:strand:+ start:412 stop:1584 length:1173 start_codon:yes stop_codon:yes gene_type:complete
MNKHKMNGNSYNPQEELLNLLKVKFPEILTEGKVDTKKLKITLGDSVNRDTERYGLSWAGKSDCFRHIQEPTTATLKPVKKESVDFDNTQNLFIEGDNLEVLKVLQKSYYNKIKMIYIDPPYNTGNDSFIYPDWFQESQEEYLKRAGEIDEEGNLMKDGMFQKNSKESGHFHSNWLSMIYPRLFLARNLLRQDGVIFVSIDDNEVHNLRMIMNEIFGAENFVAQFLHKNNSSKNQAKLVSISSEYIFCYSKNLNILRQIEWRIEKRGAKDIAALFEKLKSQGVSLEEIDSEIKDMFKRPKYAHLSRWNKVDEKGVFGDADLSREGGPKDYTIINPETGGKCLIPDRGWGRTHKELLQFQKEGLIWYGDYKTPPRLKDYLTITDISVPDNF